MAEQWDEGGDAGAAALVRQLCGGAASSRSNVLFLSDQLALVGLVHAASAAGFRYDHMPGLRHALRVAARGAAGGPQTVVCIGDWSTTVVQAVLAALHDAAPGEAWRASLPAAEAGLHLLLLLATVGGRYCAAPLPPSRPWSLGRPPLAPIRQQQSAAPAAECRPARPVAVPIAAARRQPSPRAGRPRRGDGGGAAHPPRPPQRPAPCSTAPPPGDAFTPADWEAMVAQLA